MSLRTRYPLGVAKVVPFPTHGVIETVAGMMTAAAPWSLAFSRNRSARWTHVLSGLGTLAVVAMTDYRYEAGGLNEGQSRAGASLNRGDEGRLGEGSRETQDLHANGTRETAREAV